VAPTFCVHIFIQTSDELWFAVAVWNVLEQDTVAALDLHDYERAEVVPPLPPQQSAPTVAGVISRRRNDPGPRLQLLATVHSLTLSSSSQFAEKHYRTRGPLRDGWQQGEEPPPQ